MTRISTTSALDRNWKCSLYLFIISLIIAFPSGAQSTVDSLSYAIGYQTTLGLMAGENHLITNESEAREFIRGLEESIPGTSGQNDSTFIINYSLGGMQGVFLSDGFTHKPSDKRPPVKCIIEGLRRVADGTLTLPKDTTEAKTYISSFPDSINPIELPDDKKCNFFIAYGIMKGYQKGLQQYIEEMTGKSDIPANQKYYAKGMADALALACEPETAYDLGMLMGLSFKFNMQFTDPHDSHPTIIPADYIDGAKGALWLSDLKIDRETTERLLYQSFNSDKDVTQIDDIGKTPDIAGLNVYPDMPYDVTWQIEIFSPAMAGEVPDSVNIAIKAMISFLLNQGVKISPLHNSELIFYLTEPISDNIRKLLLAYRTATTDDIPLPDGYKYIYGTNGDGKFVFGVVNTRNSFKSEVSKAILSIHHDSGSDTDVPVIQFRFGSEDNLTLKAAEWADFTKNNIGKIVIAELNGEMITAPCVNSEIESGACTITGLPVSKINDLFSDKTNKQK